MTKSTELPVSWSPELKVPIQHVNLSETLSSIMRGIDQAARGEGKIVDPSTLPIEDE